MLLMRSEAELGERRVRLALEEVEEEDPGVEVEVQLFVHLERLAELLSGAYQQRLVFELVQRSLVELREVQAHGEVRAHAHEHVLGARDQREQLRSHEAVEVAPEAVVEPREVLLGLHELLLRHTRAP